MTLKKSAIWQERKEMEDCSANQGTLGTKDYS